MKTQDRSSFLKQSVWMMFATVGGGVAMMLVHSVVAKAGTKGAGDGVYGQFKALLASFYVIGAAQAGIATLFAQETAAAVNAEQRSNVAAAGRRFIGALLLLWLAFAAALWMSTPRLVSLWKLDHPASLWATWALALVSLATAVARGMVHGNQNFGALGLAGILDGFGRLAAVSVIVLGLGGLAAGAMTGALIGAGLAAGVVFWNAAGILAMRGGRFEWWPWIRRLLPLAIGASCLQLLQNYDAGYWQGLIPQAEAGRWNVSRWYMPAQTIGFGLTQFTIPLATVMLPRVARSTAAGEKSSSLEWTVLATLALGGAAAAGCTLLPRLPLQIMFFSKPENWEAWPMVPWFAWTMMMFTMANVYLTNLFARARFGIIGWIVLVASSYVGCLSLLAPRLLMMEPFHAYQRGVQILGVHVLALLAGAFWVSRRCPQGAANPSADFQNEADGNTAGVGIGV